ncbi:MlaD family protein [Planctomycetes bacterium K23_9]|uniref:Mce related protein n=1 Tax=Stieleria marina TaxID=1930275 RepID=A0A517P1H9_9BACT|nr:mce related protein [Planctomycetes bacterium K23_9]
MDDNKLRFGVGVLVIAAIGIGIILTFLFGAFPAVLSDEYQVTVRFDSAAGVSTNTKVLRDGVEIGRVTNVKLVEDDSEGGVQLQLAIDGTYRLSHEYIPRIGIGSVITGDAKLEFVKGDARTLARIAAEVDDPDFIRSKFTDGELYQFGDNAEDPFNMLFGLEDQVRLTMESIRGASDSIGQTGQNVNQLVGDARGTVDETQKKIDAVADEAVATLKRFQEAIIEVKDLVGDPQLKDSLQASLDRIPDVLKEAQGTFESFNKVGTQFESVGREAEGLIKEAKPIVDNLNRTVDGARSTVEGAGETLSTIDDAFKTAGRTFQSAERTIKNIERVSEPLAQNADQLVAQVMQSLRSVDRALAQVETFGSSLNNSNGTVKRLLEDDEIYWQIRRTIENVEQASARIKPILDDARIFSDKIARDPRQLGIRGAVTRRPNGMGLK